MSSRFTFSTLTQFSEPQTVFFLLAWLRLFTVILLLCFCILIKTLHVDIIEPLLDWSIILVCIFLTLVLSCYTYLFRHKDITSTQLFVVLLFDIIIWVGLISSSGGSINPAISYLLILLAIAALSLSGKLASLLTLFTILLYAIMMHLQPHMHEAHLMGWHLWGMWVLFMLNAVIMLVVIALLSRALREKDKAIALYREDTVRNEQLVSMGTMAANIAHELGTPLSTIAMLVEDIEYEDKAVIQQQIERCKNALTQLKTTTIENNQTTTSTSKQFIAQLVHEALLLKPQAHIEWQDNLNAKLLISPLLEQALQALLINAIDAARTTVMLTLYQNATDCILDIQHDGAEFSDDLLKVLGRHIVKSNKNGLGLGYYLANATIERLGGKLHIINQEGKVITRIIFAKGKIMP